LNTKIKTSETIVNSIDLTPSINVAKTIETIQSEKVSPTSNVVSHNKNKKINHIFDSADPELKESVFKLESDITKTIENNNNLKVIEDMKKSTEDMSIEKILLPDFDTMASFKGTTTSDKSEIIAKAAAIDDDYVIEDVTNVKNRNDNSDRIPFATTKMITTTTAATTTTREAITSTVVSSLERLQTTISDITPTTVPYIDMIIKNNNVLGGTNTGNNNEADTGENYRKKNDGDINFATEENVSLINSIASTQTTTVEVSLSSSFILLLLYIYFHFHILFAYKNFIRNNTGIIYCYITFSGIS
jgi:hypothetical protein